MFTSDTMNQFFFSNPIFVTITLWALKSIWPTNFKKIIPAVFFSLKLLEKLLEVLWILLDNNHTQTYKKYQLERSRLAVKTIDSETEDYILNANQTEYCEHLREKFLIDTPELHFEDVTIDSKETDIPAERFPGIYHVISGKKYKRDVVSFHVPYTGDINLLRYRPANRFTLSGSFNINTIGNALIFDYINFNDDAEAIKKEYDTHVGQMIGIYNYLKTDCEEFNNALLEYVNSVFNRRKEHLLKKKDLLVAIGVPLKHKEGLTGTFSIPTPKTREKITVKPIVTAKGFEPEPTLNIENYSIILKLINDMGKNFERMPSIYVGKHEEDLRDHILMMLDPNFEYGSASGETFNKSGKTDIQLRYNSSVVFIAECKFWDGEKSYFKTIDQLLGYLTWRDSKTSVILFVKNKDFSTVLMTVKEVTKNHPNYLSEKRANDETWYNYIFCLPTDRNKEIRMAVQLFHLP